VAAHGRKTLDRAMSRAGLCSRSQAQAAIAQGRVQVNGRVVRDPETWVDPVRDRITFDQAPVQARRKEVWLLHKPVGYVTTAADERGRDTVYALLPADATWLGPVGRLDRDSSGLLLFTNDSDLANAITAPDSKLPKTYLVRVQGAVDDATLARLRSGIELHDGPTRPAVIERVEHDGRSTLLRFVLTEGRNRQIRRMVTAIGSQVLTLHRTRIGPLELGCAAEGSCRALRPDEVAALRAAVTAARDRSPPTRGAAPARSPTRARRP
jgi:pseudouridine synthase